MAWHGKTLGELMRALHAEFGEFHYGRVDLGVTARQKEKAITHFTNPKLQRLRDWPIVRRETMDGIKLYLGEIGWLMFRASGTENLLRIYSETNHQETTQRVLRAAREAVVGL
jgi:phosphomannomutase